MLPVEVIWRENTQQKEIIKWELLHRPPKKNDLFCPKYVDKTSNINFLIRKYLKIFGEHKQELQNDVIIDTFLGHWEIVYLLLLNGADANKQIINGDTALHVATEKGIQSG